MSTVPNAYGAFLSNSTPFLANYAAFGGPNGTFLKPGGRVAAYVRSTGAQEGDDQFAATGLLVTSINEGLKRCRSGQNDIVYVLPGHTETYSSSGVLWANLVAGAQIVSAGIPGSSGNATITLANTGASLAFNVADVSVIGLNIRGSTAAVTAPVSITAAGATFAGNSVIFTGAGGANAPIQLAGGANAVIVGNNIVADSTAAVINVSVNTSTNFLIAGNVIRQAQGTSGGAGINVANTALISGFIIGNYIKSATDGTPASLGVVVGAGPIATVGSFENYAMDGGSGGSGLLSPTVGS